MVLARVLQAHVGDLTLDELAHQIAAAGEITYDSAGRALRRLNERDGVSELAADRILTALDLHHLWHTDPGLAGPGR